MCPCTSLRRSREGGNPYVDAELDARLRGHDDLGCTPSLLTLCALLRYTASY
jgi:hypothetical protein